MRRRPGPRLRAAILAAGAVTLALGALGSGCLWKRGDHTLGSFCAAAVGGEEHCVGENLGPGSAWSKAEKDGALPIEMWATWPSDKTLDDVVARTHRLDQWFGHLDEAIEYVRDDARNAESLRATLSGKLASLLDEATDRQRALLAQTPVDAAGNFKAAMIDRASAEREPLVAALAADKQGMAVVQGIFDPGRRRPSGNGRGRGRRRCRRRPR